eukprot:scaffold120836_cov19-Tisochrysis_lutea.AAC.1
MEQLSAAKEAKTYKDEVVIESPQGSQGMLHLRSQYFCFGPGPKSNSLGVRLIRTLILFPKKWRCLSNHPDICEAAIQAIRVCLAMIGQPISSKGDPSNSQASARLEIEFQGTNRHP